MSEQQRSWRITDMLTKLRNGAVTHKDVKNEATSGDVHENTGPQDNMADNQSGF